MLKIELMVSVWKAEEHVFFTQLTLGMSGKDWALEERVKCLLSDKRETALKLNNVVSKVIQFLMISVSVFLAACQINGGTSDSIAITAGSNEAVVQPINSKLKRKFLGLIMNQGLSPFNQQIPPLEVRRKHESQQNQAMMSLK